MADPVQADVVETPSLLLALPSEVLEMIMIKYFENASLLVVRDPTVVKSSIYDMVSLNIERTCKALREVSLATRNKVLSKKLIVCDSDFVPRLDLFCSRAELKWVREHITSVEAQLEPDLPGIGGSWPFPMVKFFPKLKNFHFHDEIDATSTPRFDQRYLPLESDRSKRRLARAVMKTDLMRPTTRLSVQSRLYELEKNYHEARKRCARENIAYMGPRASELNITFTLQTVLTSKRNGLSVMFDAETVYKSEGWQGRQSHEDFDLIVLSKSCEVGDIKETYVRGMEE